MSEYKVILGVIIVVVLVCALYWHCQLRPMHLLRNHIREIDAAFMDSIREVQRDFPRASVTVRPGGKFTTKTFHTTHRDTPDSLFRAALTSLGSDPVNDVIQVELSDGRSILIPIENITRQVSSTGNMKEEMHKAILSEIHQRLTPAVPAVSKDLLNDN